VRNARGDGASFHRQCPCHSSYAGAVRCTTLAPSGVPQLPDKSTNSGHGARSSGVPEQKGFTGAPDEAATARSLTLNCPPAGLSDPDAADKLAASLLAFCCCKPSMDEARQRPTCEAVNEHGRTESRQAIGVLSAAVGRGDVFEGELASKTTRRTYTASIGRELCKFNPPAELAPAPACYPESSPDGK
jgi:hypothetical protein